MILPFQELSSQKDEDPPSLHGLAFKLWRQNLNANQQAQNSINKII